MKSKGKGQQKPQRQRQHGPSQSKIKRPAGSFNKMKKGGFKKSGVKSDQWDLVPINEEEFVDNKEMANLISLEVMTNYEIIKRPDGLTEILTSEDKKSKRNKRKAGEDSESDEDDFKAYEVDSSDENESDRDGDDESNDDFDVGPVQEEDDDNEGVPSTVEDDDDEAPSLVNVNIPKKKLKLEKEASKVALKSGKKAKNNVKNQPVSTAAAATSEWVVVGSSKDTSDTLNDDFDAEQDRKPKNSKKGKEKKDQLKSKKKLKVADKKPGGGKVEKESSRESENAEFTMEEWIQAGVQDPILKALREAGFEKPTMIQSLTLPASVLGKKDVVGAAETGSGKTLAFAIPIIYGILQNQSQSRSKGEDEEDKNQLQALILTPTRELACQIKKHFDVAAKYTRIKTVVIVGGLATQKQERLLRDKPNVVIATPGRLWELVKEGNPHLSSLEKIKYLAVDETDRMVERGHFQELEGILTSVNKSPLHKDLRQNFVFSATLAFTHEPPQRLNKSGKKYKQQPKKVSSKEKLKQIMELIGVRSNPKIVDICSKKGTCETLVEKQISCSLKQKEYYLYYFFIQHPGRTIVFCNSINTVRRLTNLFFLLKVGSVLPLHSEMHQKMRLKSLERFSEDDKGILIATDVAARGLDIVNIQHVIHYHVPKTAESYIHRSGRTARAFKGGLALVLVEPAEMGSLRHIFKSLNRDAEVMLPTFEVDLSVYSKLRSRVEEAEKVEQFEHMVRKKLADLNWMDKAKKDMDMVPSSEDEAYDSDDGKRQNRKNLLEAKKKLAMYKQTLNKMLEDDSFLLRNKIKVKN